MKTRGFLALCLGVALAAGACGGPGDDTTLERMDDRTPMTEPAPPAAATAQTDRADQMVTGTLGKVDPDARTFTMNADGRDQTFRYSDATDVSGVANIQGLAGREGSRVTVHYRDEAGAMMATRIMIEGGAGSMQQQPSGAQSGSPPQPGQQR